jgi:hypothetical protein
MFHQVPSPKSLSFTVFYDLQVKTNFRSAITVPEKSWGRFRDVFADYCEKMKEGVGDKAPGSGVENTSGPK